MKAWLSRRCPGLCCRFKPDTRISIQSNINPVLLKGGNVSELVIAFLRDHAMSTNPIARTGILSYDFSPGEFLAFRERLEKKHSGKGRSFT